MSGPAVRSMRGRWRDDVPAAAWRWLLLPAWIGYGAGVALRNRLFNAGWLHTRRLPAPVLSVGNLTAGGTGKTPLTRFLADWCRNHGLSPTILARGYGATAGQANDEACMVDECPVVCDADRFAGGQRALTDGATCLILDDGFQHRRLHRDLDLVVIDATRPWGDASGGSGALLPLGYLRENRAALARADVLAITRCDLVEPDALARLQAELAPFAKPVVRVLDGDAQLSPLRGTAPSTPPDTLRGQAVVLASGLGNPLGFERSAARHRWQLAVSLRFADHHHFTLADAQAIAAAAAEHHATVVVTAKDAVKLAELPDTIGAGWLVLHSRPRIDPDDVAALEALLVAAVTRSPARPGAR